MSPGPLPRGNEAINQHSLHSLIPSPSSPSTASNENKATLCTGHSVPKLLLEDLEFDFSSNVDSQITNIEEVY